MQYLCRDCYSQFPLEGIGSNADHDLLDAARLAPGDKRCRQCGGTRLLGHAELHSLSIAHIDCDAFFAAVEKRDHPALKDRPLVIGGGKRGVVTTACYLARIKGVRSAMPMYRALKLCPEAVVVSPNFAKYQQAGREVRARMLEVTDRVQPLSIDEAFLDLTALRDLGKSPATALLRLAGEIAADLRLTVSIGLSHNKLLAKIASDMDKPSGFFVIGEKETQAFLGKQPVSILWGVGRATASRLAKRGITSVGDLQGLSFEELQAQYGSFGYQLYNFSRGIDKRPVREPRKSKSISTETTFSEDLSALEELEIRLSSLIKRLKQRLEKSGYSGRTITLKLKTSDFQLLTRSQSLKGPTVDADLIQETALALLRREVDGRSFRLMGVGLHDLFGADEAEVFDLARGPSTSSD